MSENDYLKKPIGGGGGAGGTMTMPSSIIVEDGITYTQEQYQMKLLHSKIDRIEKKLAALIEAISANRQS